MPAKAGIQNHLKILDSAKASLRAPPFEGMTPKDVLRLFTKPSILNKEFFYDSYFFVIR